MPNAMKTDVILDTLFQVARDVGSKVEKAEKPEVPKFVVDRYSVDFVHQISTLICSPSTQYLQCDAIGRRTFSNREKTCPLLLRVFCSQQRHNNMSEYMRGKYDLTQGF